MTLNIFAEIEPHPHVNIASYTVVHDKGHLEKDAGTCSKLETLHKLEETKYVRVGERNACIIV